MYDFDNGVVTYNEDGKYNAGQAIELLSLWLWKQSDDTECLSELHHRSQAEDTVKTVVMNYMQSVLGQDKMHMMQITFCINEKTDLQTLANALCKYTNDASTIRFEQSTYSLDNANKVTKTTVYDPTFGTFTE